MLNYRITARGTPREREIVGETSFICRNGHRTEVWLKYDGWSAIGGSAWDWCSWCEASPTQAQATRMAIDIIGAWLKSGKIDALEHRSLANAVVEPEWSSGAASIPALGLPVRAGQKRGWPDLAKAADTGGKL